MDHTRYFLLITVVLSVGFVIAGWPRWPLILTVVAMVVLGLPMFWRQKRYLDFLLYIIVAIGITSFLWPGQELMKTLVFVIVLLTITVRFTIRSRRILRGSRKGRGQN